MIRRRLPLALAFTLAALSVRASGHSGPPFPILSDKAAGPYLISIWTDPDNLCDCCRRLPAGSRDSRLRRW